MLEATAVLSVLCTVGAAPMLPRKKYRKMSSELLDAQNAKASDDLNLARRTRDIGHLAWFVRLLNMLLRKVSQARPSMWSRPASRQVQAKATSTATASGVDYYEKLRDVKVSAPVEIKLCGVSTPEKDFHTTLHQITSPLSRLKI